MGFQEEGIIDITGVDTKRFLDLSRREGTSPLLYRILKGHSLINIFPSFVQDSLKKSYLITFTYNTVLMHDLSTLLASLEEEEIRTVVLKGPALLERIYPDIGVRPVMDIDLLLCNGEDKAGKVFEDLGYRLISDRPRIYDNGRTILDIHKEIDSFTRLGPISYTPKLNTTSLWEDGHPWREGFESVRILSAEDEVLTLSIHLLKHSFLRLIWYIDIIKVIEKNPCLKWERLGERARVAGLERLLYDVLFNLRENFGLVPEGFLSEIRPQKLGLIERGIMKRILSNQRSEGYGDLLYILAIPGLLKKVLFAKDILFPSWEKMVEISRVRSPYLYYPRRISGLLVMMGNALLNYIRGNGEGL